MSNLVLLPLLISSNPAVCAIRLATVTGSEKLLSTKFIPENRKQNQKVRKMFYGYLDEMKIGYAKSHANSVWVRTDDSSLPKKLSAQGILFGARNLFVGFEGLRVAVGTAEEMRTFARVLKNLRT